MRGEALTPRCHRRCQWFGAGRPPPSRPPLPAFFHAPTAAGGPSPAYYLPPAPQGEPLPTDAMAAASWPRPIAEYCLPAPDDFAGWLSMASPWTDTLEVIDPPDATAAAGGAPSSSRWKRLVAAARRSIGCGVPDRHPVPVVAYLLLGLHWRERRAGESPAQPTASVVLAAGGDAETASSGDWTTVAFGRDVRGRQFFDVSVADAAEGTARVFLVHVREGKGRGTHAFLADSVGQAAEWRTRLRRRAAPEALFYEHFLLIVGRGVSEILPAPPAAAAAGVGGGGGGDGSSSTPRSGAAAEALDGICALAEKRDALTSAAQVVALLAAPATVEAVAAAGPAVGLVVGSLLGAARVTVSLGSLPAALRDVAEEVSSLFDQLNGGLVDLLPPLLARDDPPVPVHAKQVLLDLLASLTDRLEMAACAQMQGAHSRHQRMWVALTAEGGPAAIRATLASIRGDVQLLLNMIATRHTAQLVARQDEVRTILASADVGALADRLSNLLALLQRATAELGATAARMVDAADAVNRRAAEEEEAQARSMRTYAALLTPSLPGDEVVADWADTSRPERLIYDTVLGAAGPVSTSPAAAVLMVGLSGMGGSCKSTTAQLVRARVATEPAARSRFSGGGAVWIQLHKDLNDTKKSDAAAAGCVAPVEEAGGEVGAGPGRNVAGDRRRRRGEGRPPVPPGAE